MPQEETVKKFSLLISFAIAMNLAGIILSQYLFKLDI